MSSRSFAVSMRAQDTRTRLVVPGDSDLWRESVRNIHAVPIEAAIFKTLAELAREAA